MNLGYGSIYLGLSFLSMMFHSFFVKFIPKWVLFFTVSGIIFKISFWIIQRSYMEMHHYILYIDLVS
jgi:hypothetical protein